MVKGILRFHPLKEGGITITVDIPAKDGSALIGELATMYGKEVVISAIGPDMLSPQNELYLARRALEAISTALDTQELTMDAESPESGAGEPLVVLEGAEKSEEDANQDAFDAEAGIMGEQPVLEGVESEPDTGPGQIDPEADELSQNLAK